VLAVKSSPKWDQSDIQDLAAVVNMSLYLILWSVDAAAAAAVVCSTPECTTM
jgi:hypothetical protein